MVGVVCVGVGWLGGLDEVGGVVGFVGLGWVALGVVWWLWLCVCGVWIVLCCWVVMVGWYWIVLAWCGLGWFGLAVCWGLVLVLLGFVVLARLVVLVGCWVSL